eukprot:COSAG06_NODE_7323_length_2546_cov_2.090723_1_plen_54_part_10
MEGAVGATDGAEALPPAGGRGGGGGGGGGGGTPGDGDGSARRVVPSVAGGVRAV